MKGTLNYLITASILFFGCNHAPLQVEPREVEEIKLIEVAHHYRNETIDSWEIEKKKIPNLLQDLENAHPVSGKRIFSCHELTIFYKTGKQQRFITDGRFLERISDKTQYEFNLSVNLITKYWGVSEKEFCIKRGFKD